MATPLLIGDILQAAALRTPRHVAAWHGERSITFTEARAQAEEIAQAMLASGVERGDRVVWIAETCIEAMAVYFACAFVGAIFTPLNPKSTDLEIERVLSHCEPRLVLGDGAGRMALADLLGRKPDRALALPDVDEDDPQVMYYTSGTTGSPKGCLLSHRTQRLRAGPGSPWPVRPTVIMFPQFHMASWSRALTWWTQSSAPIYIERADAEIIVREMHKHRSDALRAIPAVWRRVAEMDRTGYDLSCLKRAETGTSMVTQELVSLIKGAFPSVEISIAYGSTEAWLICALGPDDIERKPGAVGLPSPGVILREGQDGEVIVKTPYVFSGYFRNDEANARAFEDGFFRTGDLAEIDDEGYRTIIGRAGDLIRSGGEWVSPAEVESILQGHPSVADAAVIGVSDPDWGQVVTALVVPRAGESVTLEMLRGHCASALAPHKHPRRLKIVENLPRTPATGQIQRRLLEA